MAGRPLADELLPLGRREVVVGNLDKDKTECVDKDQVLIPHRSEAAPIPLSLRSRAVLTPLSRRSRAVLTPLPRRNDAAPAPG